MAMLSKFTGSLDKDEFFALFLNEQVMKRDVNLWDKDHGQPPDITELAEIFEFLDEDHAGMISANDLMQFLETAERLKLSQFDYGEYTKQRQITSQ